MKDNKQKETAQRFGILNQCEALENDLLKIPGVASVDFDLDGFFDNLHQVILLIEYDIDVKRGDCFEALRELKKHCIMAMLSHGLNPSGDAIEDYGRHLYFVRQCGKHWTATKNNNH